MLLSVAGCWRLCSWQPCRPCGGALAALQFFAFPAPVHCFSLLLFPLQFIASVYCFSRSSSLLQLIAFPAPVHCFSLLLFPLQFIASVYCFSRFGSLLVGQTRIYRGVLSNLAMAYRSPVRTLPAAPLWCDLVFVPNSRGNKAAANRRLFCFTAASPLRRGPGGCSRTVAVNKANGRLLEAFAQAAAAKRRPLRCKSVQFRRRCSWPESS